MFEGLNSVEHISGSESLQELNMNLSGQKGLSTNQVPQHFPKDIKKKTQMGNISNDMSAVGRAKLAGCVLSCPSQNHKNVSEENE